MGPLEKDLTRAGGGGWTVLGIKTTIRLIMTIIIIITIKKVSIMISLMIIIIMMRIGIIISITCLILIIIASMIITIMIVR